MVLVGFPFQGNPVGSLGEEVERRGAVKLEGRILDLRSQRKFPLAEGDQEFHGGRSALKAEGHILYPEKLEKSGVGHKILEQPEPPDVSLKPLV
jgi:hypothetical protein